MMPATVVIRTKDEADRLRLTLASLAQQSVSTQVVVVDDGSSDHTRAVLAEAAAALTLVAVHHKFARGRSEASNVGARAAGGDILIFLDGDTLAAPDFVARHLDVHRAGRGRIARGETWHLRSTRFVRDPETLSAMPGETDRIARMGPAERERMRISRTLIAEDFAEIVRRAQPGIYPGAGPRQLYELEMAALHDAPGCPVLWAAASGSNQSVPRAAYLAAGGFDARLSINEHRELALRMCEAGARMVPASGARSFHMTHRSGWRDPLEDLDWEALFYDKHPQPAVALLGVLWASLAEPPQMSREERIASLPELATAAARCSGIIGLQAVRATHRDHVQGSAVSQATV